MKGRRPTRGSRQCPIGHRCVRVPGQAWVAAGIVPSATPPCHDRVSGGGLSPPLDQAAHRGALWESCISRMVSVRRRGDFSNHHFAGSEAIRPLSPHELHQFTRCIQAESDGLNPTGSFQRADDVAVREHPHETVPHPKHRNRSDAPGTASVARQRPGCRIHRHRTADPAGSRHLLSHDFFRFRCPFGVRSVQRQSVSDQCGVEVGDQAVPPRRVGLQFDLDSAAFADRHALGGMKKLSAANAVRLIGQCQPDGLGR